MTMKLAVGALLLALLAGYVGYSLKDNAGNWIDPSQAVQLAAAAQESGVTGVFAMTVKATGKDGHVYLNSEADYRDPRNLSVVIDPVPASQWAGKLGTDAELAWKGKRILVSGTARRTKIVLSSNGQPTDKYYYQTQISVTDSAQIKLP